MGPTPSLKGRNFPDTSASLHSMLTSPKSFTCRPAAQPNPQAEKPSKRMLAMDRVAAAAAGGRGGAQGRSFGGNSRRGAPQGYAAQAADEGYAARAASSSGGKGRELDGGGGGGRDSSSRNRDEFKEYALAVRKRDRRGRADEQPDPRDRVGVRSHRGKDYSQVSGVLGIGSGFAELFKVKRGRFFAVSSLFWLFRRVC